MDLASSDSGSGAFSVLMNNGNGTFTRQPEGVLHLGTGRNVTWGDYNNDGYTDLLVEGSSDVVLLLNKADGTFENKIVYSSANFSNVLSTHFNNDGSVDLIIVDYEPDLYEYNDVEYLSKISVLKQAVRGDKRKELLRHGLPRQRPQASARAAGNHYRVKVHVYLLK